MDDAQGQSEASNDSVSRINSLAGSLFNLKAASRESSDSRIDKIAGDYLEGVDQIQDPNRNALFEKESSEEPEAEPQPEGEPTPEAEKPEESDLEEYEFQGRQYQVPKELKAALEKKVSSADADYTRKTQEVAESRKQVERIQQAAQKLFEQAQQFAPYYGQAQAVESQIEELSKKLTPDLEESDPFKFVQVHTKLQALVNQRNQLVGQLQHASQEYQQQAHLQRLQALAADFPKLQQDIPGIEKPEFRQGLAKWGLENGLSESDLGHVSYSAGLFRLLHLARKGQEMEAKAAETAKALKAKVKDLPAVKPTGRTQDSPEGREKQLRRDFRKAGGKFTDPNLDRILDSKLDRLFKDR